VVSRPLRPLPERRPSRRNLVLPSKLPSARREPSGNASLEYLPVSRPDASGDQIVVPSPISEYSLPYSLFTCWIVLHERVSFVTVCVVCVVCGEARLVLLDAGAVEHVVLGLLHDRRDEVQPVRDVVGLPQLLGLLTRRTNQPTNQPKAGRSFRSCACRVRYVRVSCRCWCRRVSCRVAGVGDGVKRGVGWVPSTRRCPSRRSCPG